MNIKENQNGQAVVPFNKNLEYLLIQVINSHRIIVLDSEEEYILGD